MQSRLTASILLIRPKHSFFLSKRYWTIVARKNDEEREISMTNISPENKVYTLINVFTVDPDKQQQLADTLIETTERWVKSLPGFVSASIHKSLDGTRVVNYAQWENKEAFDL